MHASARLALAALFLVIPQAVFAAQPYRLAPYKDDLFQYPAIIDSEDDGDYVVVSYTKPRDLYGRDAIMEKQAKPEYITQLGTEDRSFQGAGDTLQYIGVGMVDGGAKAVVIYIHGQGGSRFQGADQGMFGGNFNRIMNLMVRNQGAYLSPDFSDFGTTGEGDIKALILDQATRSPKAAIFIACGSHGGDICWRIAADPEASPHISGLLLLGSNHDDGFLKSDTMKPGGHRFPIYLGHGTADPIFAWQEEVAFYHKVRKAAPDYPIKIALFDTGVHGTPIRMTDWRLTLNWMLQVDGR